MKTLNGKVFFGLLSAFVGLPLGAKSSVPIGNIHKHSNYTSICDVYNNKDHFLGKTIRLHATYETDGGSYSYFREKASKSKICLGKDIIDMARRPDMRDRTVVHFFDDGRTLCAKNNMTLCGLTADVDFEATVLMRMGDPYLYLTRIISYRYRDLAKR